MRKPADYLIDYRPRVDVENDPVITLDFETYWDSKTFTLKKMSMEEYVRDPRFRMHGVGVKVNDQASQWFPGHDDAIRVLQALPFSRAIALGQNTLFDGLILNERCGVKPKVLMDTMPMCAMVYGNNVRSLSLAAQTRLFLPGHVKDQSILFDTDGKLHLSPAELDAMGEYCRGDCDKTYALYKLYLRYLQTTPTNLDVIDLVTRMFTEPMLMMNDRVLSQLIAHEAVEKEAAVASCIAFSRKELNSNPKMAVMLRSLGVEPPVKLNKKGLETLAMAKDDREFVALVHHENEHVRSLVAARLRVKSSINETRAQKYLEVSSRGTWPVHLIVSGARTTQRLSGGPGGGGNPQNLGKKSPLREAIEPPDGFRMLAIDSKSIEMRGQIALAFEETVRQRLFDPLFDLYKVFGASVYQVPLSEATDHIRGVGKVGMLSLGYGSGAPKFQHTAWTWGITLPDVEAGRVVSMYRNSFPGITKAWKICGRLVVMLARGEPEEWANNHLARPIVDGPMGHPAIELVNSGTFITYPNLRRELDKEEGRYRYRYDTFDKKSRRLIRADLYGAKLWQHICQALCRNVLVDQMLAVDEFLKREISFDCRTVMQVHDESMHLIPDHADHDLAMQGALEIYGTAPSWWPGLPVFGEAAYGINYLKAKP